MNPYLSLDNVFYNLFFWYFLGFAIGYIIFFIVNFFDLKDTDEDE